MAVGILEGAGVGFVHEGVVAVGILEGAGVGFVHEREEAVGILEGAGAEFALEGVGYMEVAALVGREELAGQVKSSFAVALPASALQSVAATGSDCTSSLSNATVVNREEADY